MAYLLHQAMDASAERYAERPAFLFPGTSIDYQGLAERTNRLAWVLADQGVTPGDRVGIYLNKSIVSAIAIYGIMKAGAAYVPLDPAAPAPRLANTLRHCGIRHLVTHGPKARGLCALLEQPNPLECVIGTAGVSAPGVRTLDWPDLDGARGDRMPERRTMEQDIAYIMYTSGSTGAPKGIAHTHASGLAYARLSADTYGLTHEDRLSNHSPLHFDMSTLDYFSGPLRGAATLIIPEAYTKLPASLTKLIEDERVTIWYSVPFALIQMLSGGVLDERDLSSLRWVLFGGEPFPAKHLRALKALWPRARFSNVYGPAEVNQCTFHHLGPDEPRDEEPPPIGRVWPNAEGLVVGVEDEQVPRGEPGELLIRAPTMMRGYWDAPDLNAKAFFHRAGPSGMDDLFYRTGDLVRERDDGALLFLGRKDRQIKTRGYRVELDEIEVVLTRRVGVEESAAYVVDASQDDPVLEAAVILGEGCDGTAEELRAHCARYLPPYAVPETVVVLPSFARTGSGKIDRKVLQQLAVERRAASD